MFIMMDQPGADDPSALLEKTWRSNVKWILAVAIGGTSAIFRLAHATIFEGYIHYDTPLMIWAGHPLRSTALPRDPRR